MYGWYLSYGLNEGRAGAFSLAESLVAGKSIDTNAVTFLKHPQVRRLIMSKRVSHTFARLAGFAGLLAFSAGLLWLPSSAPAQEGDNAATIDRFIAVVKDQKADRTQRINASVALSKKDFKSPDDRAVRALIAFAEELILEPVGFTPYLPKTQPGLDTVAHALGDMGEQAEPAVPLLMRILLNRAGLESYKRRAAAEALGQIGSAKALPALIEAARQDRDPYVRQGVAIALTQMAPKNKDAATELKIIAEIDPEQRVREEAGAPKKEKEPEKAPEKMPEKVPEKIKAPDETKTDKDKAPPKDEKKP
jgi:hypothetical protein